MTAEVLKEHPKSGSTTFSVINPATGLVFAQAPDASDDDLDRVVTAAAGAFPSWSGDEELRRQGLRDAAAVIYGAAEKLAAILTTEQGKPLQDAVLEVYGAAYWLSYYADIEDKSEIVQDDDTAYVEVLRRPLGPVAAITPWNFPIALSMWKIAPALRAGNTVVVKPSPYTPLATIEMINLLGDVFPPGVLSVITGRDPLGAKLVAHPGIRKVSFTGSTATGKRVAAAAAEDLKRVTLELGGNDPAIVLPDADPAKVADGIFRSAMANNGQICMAIKRTYVHESMYSELVDALAACAGRVVLGDGADPATTHGPVNNLMQFDRVRELVGDAVDAGGTIVHGGTRWGTDGYFFEPTIIKDVSDGVRVVDEEQFGPILPIVSYRSVDDAVARANASHYGLGSSIWTDDVDAARKIALRIEAGTTWINNHLQVMPAQPFGGTKWSGIGVEGGHWGLHSFSEVHVLHTSR